MKKNFALLLVLVFLGSISCQEKIDIEKEKEAIIAVIQGEKDGFSNMDFDQWSKNVLQDSSYIWMASNSDEYWLSKGYSEQVEWIKESWSNWDSDSTRERIEFEINDSIYKLRLTRSLGLDERSQVKLAISDTSVKARIYYRRFPTNDSYKSADFSYRVYPIDSYIMNRIFKMYEEKGLFADIPPQPAAGKIQYYVEITDYEGTRTIMKDEPIVVRYKGSVPGYILLPHVLLMFFAMLLSTLAGLLAIRKNKAFRKYATWTLVLFVVGGMILGPVVQLLAFGDLWTGIPFGWDLTDNKTLIALIFWILAVYMNRKKEKPLYIVLAAIVLLLVYSIPHSLFGSELNYESGEVIQGLVLNLFM